MTDKRSTHRPYRYRLILKEPPDSKRQFAIYPSDGIKPFDARKHWSRKLGVPERDLLIEPLEVKGSDS